MHNQRSSSFQQLIYYLTVIAAYVGTLWGAIQVGGFHMFPFRWLILAMWLVFVINVLQNQGRLEVSFLRVTNYLKFLFFWLGYAAISMLWAADKGAALRYIIFILIGVSVVFFTVYYFRQLAHIKRLYGLWLVLFLALMAVGAWEVTTGAHLRVSGLYGESRYWVAFMPTAVFRNPNDFALFLALSLPMVLSLVWHYPSLKVRLIGLPVLAAGIWLLIETQSRACYVAVLMGLLFWLVFLLRLPKKITALIAVLGLGALIFFIFPEKALNITATLEEQIKSLDPTELQAGADSSVNIRVNLIKNSLYFTAQSFGLGVGAGNAEYYMEHRSIFPTGEITKVHNWWVELIVNGGLCVFVGYLIFYMSIFFHLWKIRRRAHERAELIMGDAFLMGWVGFAFASISSSSIIALAFQWIYCGLLLSFINYWRNKQVSRG